MENKLVELSRDLTPFMKKFCELYAETLNGAGSVRDTQMYNGKNYPQMASQLLALPKVQTYIQALREEQKYRLGISADRVLLELARMAYVDPADLYDESGCLKPINEMPEDVRRTISRVETREIFEQEPGTKKRKYVGDAKKVTLTPKEKAIELLMRYLGMFEKDNNQQRDVIIQVTGDESIDIWNKLNQEF